jgi:ferric-dicitrate binding protein FerR (iron transport regulator)
VEQNLTTLIEALSERQQTAERQLTELSAAFKALEAMVADLSKPAAPRASAAAAAPRPAQPAPEKQKKPEVTPEILVMLAAAATAFLGKEVRVRSAKMLQTPYEVINPWAQQGRVFIQASHHPRVRG